MSGIVKAAGTVLSVEELKEALSSSHPNNQVYIDQEFLVVIGVEVRAGFVRLLTDNDELARRRISRGTS